MKTIGKTFDRVAAVVMLATIVFAPPLMADAPLISEGFPPNIPAQIDFSFSDPCTGEPMSGSIFFTVYLHFHNQNRVGRIVAEGFTDNGYEMSGLEHRVFVGSNPSDFHVVRFIENQMWRNDDGRIFRFHFVLVDNWNTGSPTRVVITPREVECISGEEILPPPP